MTHLYGNPHSRTHAFGWESEKATEDAREVKADFSDFLKIVEIMFVESCEVNQCGSEGNCFYQWSY